MDSTEIRELDYRSGDGIAVTLLWEPEKDRVVVAVEDERTNDRFRIRVDAADALDAFRHPYAYDRRRRREDGALART
jgi:hypothetical protein